MAAASEYGFGDPTPEETLYLELINRARVSPTEEGILLAGLTDLAILAAIDGYGTNITLMQQEFAAIPAVAPLAFNANLITSARTHSSDMFTNAFQGHDGTDGSNIASRATTAGYNYAFLAENVYSYAESEIYGHAGFEIDWGPGPGGMQNPRGHRDNIHHADAREIGVGVVLGSNTVGSSTVGPQVVTQDIGSRANLQALLTGVAYFDFDGDGFYSIGEGISGVTISDGGDFTTTSSSSGAYTLPLTGTGAKTITFSGLGFSSSSPVTVNANENVKVDFTPSYVAPVTTGPTSVVVGTGGTYSVSTIGGASSYELGSARVVSSAPTEKAESSLSVIASISEGYQFLQSEVKAEGSSAFRLMHTQPTSQTIQFGYNLLVRSSASMSFSSRLGVAGTGEVATVDVSTNNGDSWTTVFSQTGTGAQTGETTFSTKTIDLSAFANRSVSVRFHYRFIGGSYFNAGSTIGWWIDDIAFTNVAQLDTLSSSSLSDGSATFSPSSPGNYVVVGMPRNGDNDLPFGAALDVTATGEAAPVPGHLINMSVRTRAGVGDETLIAGFYISGSGFKPLFVRSVSQRLASAPFDVPDTLDDPQLDLYSGGNLVNQNLDWSGDDGRSLGAFELDAGSGDAVLAVPLSSGGYTVHTKGQNGGTGEALVELYDAAANDTAISLINISARTQLQSEQVLIVGFYIGGDTEQTILVRAIGPSLFTELHVPGAISDPKLTVYSGSTEIDANDDWGGTTELKEIFAKVFAFGIDDETKDAAIALSLPPGGYTVHVTGVDGDSGVVLVEAYAVPTE